MDKAIKIVAIDDDPSILSVVRACLADDETEVLTSDDPEAGWDLVRRTRPDIAIVDLMMPGTNGMVLLERIVEWNPTTDVVLLTGEYRPEFAVQAIQKGASDYLTKPVDIALLRERIGRLAAAARARLRGLELEDALVMTSRLSAMVGRSPEMLGVLSRLQRIAPHYRAALITGETGTGKELAARALHSLSPVAAQAFVVCNCAAVAETLFESEMFGYVRGAFTGAIQDRIGLFEAAQGGTIFLDEIGEVPQALQGKLLRVLQNHEVQRVGSPAVRKIDVRVIGATNRDLRAMVAKGQFREDLYYRLSMVQVQLPRLADRREDLPLLIRHFLQKYTQQFSKNIRGLTQRANLLLTRHDWPGNVRELENAIGHACMMASGNDIDVGDLPEDLQDSKRRQDITGPQPLLTLAEMERRHTRSVLARVGGNKQEAAAVLGISRTTLYRILNEPATGGVDKG